MNWTFDQPEFGSIIRVRFDRIFYHYGIYVSDEEIIQFGYNPNLCSDMTAKDIAICTSDMERFLCGGFLETEKPDAKEAKRRRTADETVLAARNRLGETGYSILHNNCEHFAFECAYGERRLCVETRSVREKVRSALGIESERN